MSDDKGFEVTVQVAKEVAKLLYEDLGRPVAAKIAAALGTALDIVLLPLLLLGNPATKAAMLIRKNLSDFARCLERVADENVQAIPNEIGVPIVERLKHTDDQALKNAYMELAAKAADLSNKEPVHPSFIRVVDALSPDETLLVERVRSTGDFPYVYVKMVFLEVTEDEIYDPIDQGRALVTPGISGKGDLTGFENEIGLRFPEKLTLYLNNFVALGLLERRDSAFSDVKKWYVPIERKYENERRDIVDQGHKGKKYPVAFVRGHYSVTQFGAAFFRAITE